MWLWWPPMAWTDCVGNQGSCHAAWMCRFAYWFLDQTRILCLGGLVSHVLWNTAVLSIKSVRDVGQESAGCGVMQSGCRGLLIPPDTPLQWTYHHKLTGYICSHDLLSQQSKSQSISLLILFNYYLTTLHLNISFIIISLYFHLFVILSACL